MEPRNGTDQQKCSFLIGVVGQVDVDKAVHEVAPTRQYQLG